MSEVKIIGKIVLPEVQQHKCTCDDCGCELDDSFGDPRVEIKTTYWNNEKPSSTRMICEHCADELFADHEPNSIFD